MMRSGYALLVRCVQWSGRGRRPHVAAGLLTAFALLLRLRAAWRWNRWHVNGPERLLYGDEPSYNRAALELLAGNGFPSPDRLPLYPSWIALLHRLSGENYDVIPLAQAFLGAGSVLLVYVLCRRLFGHPAPLIAAFLAATSFVLVRQSVHVLTEVMFTPALLLVTIALTAAFQAPSASRFAGAGACVGIANLIRPTLLFFPAFVAVALIVFSGGRPAVRHALAYVLAALLVTAPWTAHNYVRHGAFLPLATSNATLWLGSPEYYRLTRDEGYTYYRIWDEVIYPDDPDVPYPTTIEGERYWTRRAMASIRSEPLLYVRFALEKLVTYWTGDPNADWSDTWVFNFDALRAVGHPRAQAAQIMLARFLPFLALVGAIVLWRRWRALLPVYLLVAYCTLLHAATVARARMSEPLQPIVLIVIAGAITCHGGGQRRQAP